MKNKGVGLARSAGQKRIDLAKEDRDDLRPLLRCGCYGQFWQAFRVS
jgi:hypothetical protein